MYTCAFFSNILYVGNVTTDIEYKCHPILAFIQKTIFDFYLILIYYARLQ